MESVRITEKAIAEILRDEAYVLVTQQETNASGQYVESLRRIPLGIIIKKCGAEASAEEVKRIVEEYLAANPPKAETEQPDWNANEGESGHVLNRTHWAEWLQLIYDGNLDGAESIQVDTAMWIVKMSDSGLSVSELVGKTAVIVGTDGSEMEYTFTEADVLDLSGEGMPAIVCMYNEVPFIWSLISDITDSGITVSAGLYFIHNEADGVVTYTKSMDYGEIVHKLDNKFIDAEWMATMRDKVEVYPETEYENYMDFGNAISHLMNVGQKICVTFSGIDYWCTGFSSEGMGSLIGDINVYFGNAMVGKSIGMGSFTGDNVPDTGEPFILYGNASAAYCMQYTAGTYSVGVYVEGEEPNRLPEKFLPEGYSKDELVAAVIAALPNAEEVTF